MIHVCASAGELSFAVSVEGSYSPDLLDDAALHTRRSLMTMVSQLADSQNEDEVEV